ncbi:hypothetical protein GC194_03945 [bacterium]|nr:hypothetical protein [bacterium]
MNRSLENKLQDKLANLDVKPEAKNWKKIEEGLQHPFEYKLKNRLNGISAVVSAGTWSTIESKMPHAMETTIRQKVADINSEPAAEMWGKIASSIESMPGTFEMQMADKMFDATAAVPANAFNGIAAKLNQNSGRDRRRAIASIAAIIALFGTILLAPKSTQVENTHLAANTATEKEATYRALANDAQNNTEQTAGQVVATENNASAEDLSHTLAALDLNGDNNHANKLANNTSGNGDNNHLHNLTNNSTNSGDKTESMEKENAAYGATPTLAFINDLNINKLANADLSIKTKEASRKMAHASEPESIELPASGNGVMLTTAFQSGMFNLNSQARPGITDYFQQANNINNDISKTGSFLSLNAGLEMPITGALSLVSGINLTVAQQKIEFSVHQPNSSSQSNRISNTAAVTSTFNPDYNLLESKGDAAKENNSFVNKREVQHDSITQGNTYSLANQLLLVDFPVGLNLKFRQREKSSFCLRLGAKLRLVGTAHTYHVTEDQSRIIEVSPAVSQTFYHSSLVGYAGFSYNHNLGNNLEMFIGPEYNFNITNMNKAETWTNIRPVQLGLSIGLRQKV